ncbi:hypothetical protein ACMUMS_17320 [Acinetobacter courvalinii]|uniref:hypothetical protein n=1 Tax=Acinetobacter courvalinii TaxID=280147 RepID=UPI003A898718
MLKLYSSPLKNLPVTGLTWDRDLLFFEGPLLSEFTAKNNEKYLKYWCDCDDLFNRWMFFRIKEEDRLRLVLGELSLLECITSRTTNFVIFVDENEQESKYQLVNLSDIPDEYLPELDAYLSVEEYVEDVNIASLVFEDSWGFDDLKEVYRKLTQLYDFIFVAKKNLGTSGGMPWQEGFSAMHFYNKLKDMIPSSSNSYLDAIHYASPGYMKVKMDSDIANFTFEDIDKYKKEKLIVDQTYNDLSNKIKDLGSNNLSVTSAIDEFSKDKDCQKNYKLLVSKLYCVDLKWLNKFADSDFERCKILMAHTRRLKTFQNFIEDGRIRLVTSIIKDN